MHFITSILTALWAWEFIKVYIRFPDWIIHLIIVPGVAYLAWILPVPYAVVLAITGAVMLIQRIFGSSTSVPQTKRKSRMPPPP